MSSVPAFTTPWKVAAVADCSERLPNGVMEPMPPVAWTGPEAWMASEPVPPVAESMVVNDALPEVRATLMPSARVRAPKVAAAVPLVIWTDWSTLVVASVMAWLVVARLPPMVVEPDTWVRPPAKVRSSSVPSPSVAMPVVDSLVACWMTVSPKRLTA